MPFFHFFSSQFATKFHIARGLRALGWQEAPQKEGAIFSDMHLKLNDDISKHLEYKHLLYNLVLKHCPDIMPLSYCVDENSYESVLAKIAYKHYVGAHGYEKNIKNLKWILKPSMLNNADHILLFNNIEEMTAHFHAKNRLGGPQVIQQYLMDPDLLEGRKYTFRVSAVVTNYAGIFLYKQGYVNISKHLFKDDGFENKKIHITNYVLDGKFSEIEQRSTQDIADFPKIYEQMLSIVTRVIKALLKEHPSFLQPKKIKAFEIFGFDFIRDSRGKIWLLEINQAPDAPTFEKNSLDTILWNVFWQDLIQEFVLPIAENTSPRHAYKHYEHVLKPQECYMARKHLWAIFKKRIFAS